MGQSRIVMAGGRFAPWSVCILLAATACIAGGCSPDHDCKPNVVRVDETSISIHCSLVCLPGVPVSWFNDTNDLLPDKTSDLAVRNRGVQAVGGKCYRCQCKNLSHAIESECHQIWVDPIVTMSASKMAVKLGSSVSITCTADGYPPPNHRSYFKLHDPTNHLIDEKKFTLNDTTVTYYISNVSGLDGGEYDCTVILNLMKTLQGSSKLNMPVYAPPVISKIRNLTPVLFESGLSTAVLECVVNSSEPNLEVWVNWTRGSRSIHQLEEGSNTTGMSGDAYLLILYNISESHMYTCNLFSAYSSQYPEDHKSLKVTAAEPCTRTLSPTNSTGGLSPNNIKEERTCCITGIIIGAVGGFIGIIMTIILGIVICVVYRRLKKSKVSDTPRCSRSSTTSAHAMTNLDRHIDIQPNGSVVCQRSGNGVDIENRRNPDVGNVSSDGVSDDSSDEFEGSTTRLLLRASDPFPVSEHGRSVNPVFHRPINWTHNVHRTCSHSNS